jgi:hypothetical protein
MALSLILVFVETWQRENSDFIFNGVVARFCSRPSSVGAFRHTLRLRHDARRRIFL